MALLKDGRPVADVWTDLADDAPVPAPVPADGAVILSLTRWRAERDALVGRVAPLGVRLGGADASESFAPESLARDLPRLALVAVEFPKFRDGRGFTIGRALREHHGFGGEIRAIGHLLPDQYQLLRRCGFDAVVVADDADLDLWAAQHRRYTIAYQRAVDDGDAPMSLLRRRFATAG